MVRSRIKKSNQPPKDISVYEKAYRETLRGKSARLAAKMHGISHPSLLRYKKKKMERIEAIAAGLDAPKVTMGYNPATKIFNSEQEAELCSYVRMASKIYCGIAPKEVRRFAYDLTVKYGIKKQASWDLNATAGAEWYNAFMKRNPNLLSCISRDSNLKQKSVPAFFSNLELAMEQHRFEPKNIFNVVETGISTLQPHRLFVRKDTQDVAVSDRKNTVTMALAVNVLGNGIPPMFLFSITDYKEHFVKGGPIGCIGRGSSSAWMDHTQFPEFLKHLQRHTKSSISNKVLLTLDYHPSQITIEALDFCKENGIVILSLPPRSPHELRPLDKPVLGCLGEAIYDASNAWLADHPGETMRIELIPSLVASALPLAITPPNVQVGFCRTGIHPFRPEVLGISRSDLEAIRVESKVGPVEFIIVNSESKTISFGEFSNSPSKSEASQTPFPLTKLLLKNLEITSVPSTSTGISEFESEVEPPLSSNRSSVRERNKRTGGFPVKNMTSKEVSAKINRIKKIIANTKYNSSKDE